MPDRFKRGTKKDNGPRVSTGVAILGLTEKFFTSVYKSKGSITKQVFYSLSLWYFMRGDGE